MSSALIIRLFYYVLSPVGDQDALLYADDLLATAGTKQEIVDLGAMLLIWEALGTPWKWRKFRGGFSNSWIGYWVDFDKYEIGISETRAAWIIGWIAKALKAGSVEMADFRAVLGRIGFAVGALDFLKPFLSPLYAWQCSVDHLGKMTLPWSVSFILKYISEELRTGRRCMRIRPRLPSLGPVFRADAKAAGQTVAIGGWECRGGIPPAKARWFAVSLDRGNAPWAFSRGEPFRTIAAIELFASLISFMLFAGSEKGGEKGILNLSGLTDNSGNTSALTKLMSPKFPLIVIMTELAAQLQAKEAELDLLWIPRNQNEEADGLTNGDFSQFDLKRRIVVDVAKLEFKILPKMIAAADDLYKEAKQNKESSKAAAPAKKYAKIRPLRERDPWI